MLNLILHALFIVHCIFLNRIKLCLNVLMSHEISLMFVSKFLVTFTTNLSVWHISGLMILSLLINWSLVLACSNKVYLYHLSVPVRFWAQTHWFNWYSDFCYCSNCSLLSVVHKRKASKTILITINTHCVKI